MDVKLHKLLQRTFFSRSDLLIHKRRSEVIAVLERAVECGLADCASRKCQEIISAIVDYHRTCRTREPTLCTASFGHPILQIALKMCFSYRITNYDLVSSLLHEVYACEKTFERLFSGALFGIRASYIISNWKSDFSTREENIEAVAYFLEVATKARATFGGVRLEEVPLKDSNLPPLALAMQIKNEKMAKLLLQFTPDAPYEGCPQEPQNLLLLCKKKIRFILWKTWKLPFGIRKLPLPEKLINYLQTLDCHQVAEDGFSWQKK